MCINMMEINAATLFQNLCDYKLWSTMKVLLLKHVVQPISKNLLGWPKQGLKL